MDAVAAPLINWIGRDADIEITFGELSKEDSKQENLALNVSNETNAEPPKRAKRGRKSTSAGDALN